MAELHQELYELQKRGLKHWQVAIQQGIDTHPLTVSLYHFQRAEVLEDLIDADSQLCLARQHILRTLERTTTPEPERMIEVFRDKENHEP